MVGVVCDQVIAVRENFSLVLNLFFSISLLASSKAQFSVVTIRDFLRLFI